ncbi:hypothetical protein sos41_33480 [Alphaproteobacteria bacterium SO-S41]|nr:hypothetical protein sos41_33480 [Alphaproteobacteria bacterium SO-S41]
MNADLQNVALHAMWAAERGTLTFPEIIGKLLETGFEGYAIDYRRETATYYRPDDDSVQFETHHTATPVAPAFDADALKAAIHEAQTLAPGYTYKGFCAKAKAAGCAGYLVSFPGRRAVYFGRSGATHTEHFPGS